MPKLSEKSQKFLAECHLDLRRVVREAIKHVDFSVTEGHRGRKAQDGHYRAGRSKKRWPNSKHNRIPSDAVHCVPYPIHWKNRERFYYLAGVIVEAARQLGIRLRWGGNWRGNPKLLQPLRKKRFDDLAHFERL